MNKTLYVVRHCEASGQAKDSVLTKKGDIQTQQLLEFFKHKAIDKIISSPYTRAIRSIEPLAKELNIEIHIDDNLSERVLSMEDLDNWLECLERSFSDFHLHYSGGESNNEAMTRASKVMEQFKHSTAQTAIIVTHGNLMTLLLRYFDKRFGFEDWKRLTNPDIFQVTINSEQRVERVWEG